MENVITCNSLSKSYRNKKALNDLSIEIKKGMIVGILGPNGSGKTTLMRILSQLILKYEGNYQIETKKIGTLIENPYFYGDMTGLDNLSYYLGKKIILDEEVDFLSSKLCIKDELQKKVNTYSLGMKQKLSILYLALTKAELLVLDEPINGIDANGIVQIREIFKHMNQTFGTTIFISSHITRELENICDEVLIIKEGKLLKSVNIHNLESKTTYIIDFFNSDDLLKVGNYFDNYEIIDGKVIVEIESEEEVKMTINKLINLSIKSFSPVKNDLETVYLKTIGGDLNEK